MDALYGRKGNEEKVRGKKRKLFISRKIMTQNHAAVLYYNISGLPLRKVETKVERK